MPLTVADVLALDPVKRGAPRILAAADRLDTPVRWVHVIELADAAPLLRGGELVLSTGIALPPDPAGLARFVADLSGAGVSALAVELGSRYVRELPRALVDAAVARRLPLIVLERETQFIAVTESVHARILAAQVAELRAAERLHQVCTDLAAAGAPPDYVVAQVSALAAVPVILEDLAHRVLACAPADQDIESLLAGFAGRSRGVRVTGRCGYDPDAGWLVAIVGARQDWGRLIFVLPGPPGPAVQVLADRAATTIELASLVAEGRGASRPKVGDGPRAPRGSDAPVRAAHCSLLTALAGAGYADDAELRARIIALGVPLAGRQLLPIAALADSQSGGADDAGAIADALARASQAAGMPALTGALDDQRAVALLALPTGTDPDDVLAGLAGQVGASGPIGVGPLAATVTEARAGLDAAIQAAEAAMAGGYGGSGRLFVRLADLRLAGLAYQLRDDARVLAFAERELGPLLRHDAAAGTDLTGLLAGYLDAGANKAAAAHRAGLSRPTLYDRIDQIEQILGVGLDSAASRLALHAALLIHRMSTLPRLPD